MLFRTRWGLRLRASGEKPSAAGTVGIDVIRIRYRSLFMAGILAGIAGSYLSLSTAGSFQMQMSAGKGFIALAAMIFGAWNPVYAFGAALVFGFADATQSLLSILGVDVPPQLLNSVPYIVTIVVVAGLVGRVRGPAAAGQPYEQGLSAGYGDERGEVRARPTFYGAAAAPRTAPFGTVEHPLPLIIDSDPGLDDALAIGLAVARPEIDLLAVTTVGGNADVTHCTENALRLLHAYGARRRAGRRRGAGGAAGLVVRATEIHGESGIGDTRLEPATAGRGHPSMRSTSSRGSCASTRSRSRSRRSGR